MRKFLTACVVSTLVFTSALFVVRADDGQSPTLETLQTITVPSRDRIELARRLLNLTEIPTPEPAPDYEVGDTATFNAINLNTEEQIAIRAVLLYETEHVYMWFEQGFNADIRAVQRSAETFENEIYPTVRNLFGSEATPGIDGDPHLYILHARNLGDGIAGYFASGSTYPRAVAPESNEREMFYMNLDTMGRAIGGAGYEGTLAHEFQHMVHANMDGDEPGWVDEGLAEVAALVTGYRDQLGFVRNFMQRPETQLNAWGSLGSSAPNYGASFLFMTYFMERYGEDAIRDLVAHQENGFEGIRAVLADVNGGSNTGSDGDSLEGFFADWVVANLIDSADAGSKYGYALLTDLPSPEVRRFTTGAIDVPQWGARYVELDLDSQVDPGTYTVSIDAQDTVRVIPADARSGSHFWWSNRGDRINTRLTRAFDLRGVNSATLNFTMWQDIEENWDYGYVQVSTDGGDTWQILASQYSVSGGGNNNPYGSAFTGVSDWRQHTVDLTPFVGGEVLIRFEYITDDALNQAGMAIDDIAIPEIGYADDAESETGWISEGWARMDNLLPQISLVQYVELLRDGSVRVETLQDGDTFEVSANARGAFFALSGLTEFTTERFEMSIRFE
jgi:immune inhibitor A